MSEWQPIETVEKSPLAILAYVPISRCTFAVYWDDDAESGSGAWRLFGGSMNHVFREGMISHWMPLPPPPSN